MANQMYLHSYNGNQYEVTVNGETKYMRDRETLALYDPTVKELIDQLYPCQNTFVHRCDYKGKYIIYIYIFGNTTFTSVNEIR